MHSFYSFLFQFYLEQKVLWGPTKAFAAVITNGVRFQKGKNENYLNEACRAKKRAKRSLAKNNNNKCFLHCIVFQAEYSKLGKSDTLFDWKL